MSELYTLLVVVIGRRDITFAMKTQIYLIEWIAHKSRDTIAADEFTWHFAVTQEFNYKPCRLWRKNKSLGSDSTTHIHTKLHNSDYRSDILLGTQNGLFSIVYWTRMESVGIYTDDRCTRMPPPIWSLLTGCFPSSVPDFGWVSRVTSFCLWFISLTFRSPWLLLLHMIWLSTCEIW